MDTGASQSVYTVMSTSAVLAVRVSKLRAALHAGFAWPPQHTGAEGWPLYIEDESRGSKEEPEYLEVFLQPGTRALGSTVASTRLGDSAPSARLWCLSMVPKLPRPLLPSPWLESRLPDCGTTSRVEELPLPPPRTRHDAAVRGGAPNARPAAPPARQELRQRVHPLQAGPGGARRRGRAGAVTATNT